MLCEVEVQKMLRITGKVYVEAIDLQSARDQVTSDICAGRLNLWEVTWDDEGEYQDFSFRTTGGVDVAEGSNGGDDV